MSVCFIPPYTPLLYRKTGVYRGIHYFLFFALKHILWVLTCTHNICFEQKYENSKKNELKIVIFTAVRNRCIFIAWACFRNEDFGQYSVESIDYELN